MRKTLWAMVVLGTGLLAGAAALHAAPPHGGQGHGHGRGPFAMMHQAHFERMQALHNELNLSDAQREAMHETVHAHHADLAAAAKPVVAAKHALLDAVLADHPDDAAIRTAADGLGKSIGEAAITIAKIKMELVEKAKFTPEQLQELADFKADIDASINTFLNELEQGH
jgi:Spy/CpxP family protein refolding chaperone